MVLLIRLKLAWTYRLLGPIMIKFLISLGRTRRYIQATWADYNSDDINSGRTRRCRHATWADYDADDINPGRTRRCRQATWADPALAFKYNKE